MKFVALVSGGKDSFYSIYQAILQKHTLVACVHLARPNNLKVASDNDDNEQEEQESYMYQTAGSEVVPVLVEQCLGVPLIMYTRCGRSIHTGLVYGHQQQQERSINDGVDLQDEMEDLYQALLVAQQRFPEVEAVSSGAILSTYQRVRVEHVVCQRLGWTSLAYLWRIQPQAVLLSQMIQPITVTMTSSMNDGSNSNSSSWVNSRIAECGQSSGVIDEDPNRAAPGGITAILVKTASPPGLVPHKHLNRTLQELQSLLTSLHNRFQLHVCGEGGEYETIVLDSPLFTKRLVLDDVTIIEGNGDDGVGMMLVRSCHAQDRNGMDGLRIELEERIQRTAGSLLRHSHETRETGVAARLDTITNPRCYVCLPHSRHMTGGLWHLSEMISAAVEPPIGGVGAEEHENIQAIRETKAILYSLRAALEQWHCTSQDVVMVHVYLAHIAHFAHINALYQAFFGTLLPPSRSCVAVGPGTLPGGRRVMMDCLVLTGSGEYMRQVGNDGRGSKETYPSDMNQYTIAGLLDPTSTLRHVLHVQSRSYWAPVCVGPYSQANTVRNTLHWIAGQIGLIPATMTLQPTWAAQLGQAWTNAAAILDALGSENKATVSYSSLDKGFWMGLLYVSEAVVFGAGCHVDDVLRRIESVCRQQIRVNGGIVPGLVDGFVSAVQQLDVEANDNDEMNVVISNDDKSKSVVPLLMVSIAEMPIGAVVEVEMVAATGAATSCLARQSASMSKLCSSFPTIHPTVLSMGWDTGHVFCNSDTTAFEENGAASQNGQLQRRACQIDAHVHRLGTDCIAFSLVTAALDRKSCADLRTVFRHMLATLRELSLNLSSVLHIRCYYDCKVLGTPQTDDGTMAYPVNDGVDVRQALVSTLAAHSSAYERSDGVALHPAATVIPVQRMHVLFPGPGLSVESCVHLALHLQCIDAVQTETNLWIRQGR